MSSKQKLMEYTVLINGYLGDLTSEVNEYIKDGWCVSGGVAISWSNHESEYCQAMIKEDNEHY